ncbi:MAG: GNAT family N-acetyltransferase [Clostridia bacterium]|nr:GNAT family N-acetyltransferase [Clostridia bacterium]
MVIRQARLDEKQKVLDFYYQVIRDMNGYKYHPQWTIGVYPEDSYIFESVDNGEMFVAEEDNEYVGAMVINHSYNEGYDVINWEYKFDKSEIAIIHTLCVAQKLSRRGIGRKLVDYAIDYAKENGVKSIRLDVLYGNMPALKLYESVGFKFIKTIELFYEDTGLCKFDIYEYLI